MPFLDLQAVAGWSQRGLLALIALAGLAPSAAVAAPAYYDIGEAHTVYSLSNNGAVAAGDRPDGFFYWTPADGVTFIGGNSASAGMGHGGDAELSDDGTLLSGNSNPAGSEISEMSIYDIAAGTWTALGSLGASSGVEASSSWGISGDGKSLVGLGWINGGTAHAIQWKEGGAVTDIGSSVDGMSSRANATDFDGNVVVGWQDDEFGGRQGAVWVDGVQNKLFYDGQPVAEASVVTSDGKLVVGQAGYGTLDQPWLYNVETGEMKLLGVLNPDLFFANRGSTGISDDGRTIVGYERDFFGFPPVQDGTIWREGVGLQDLTQYALSIGLPLPEGVELTLPLTISGDGRWIAGLDSNYHGFIISVPEPGTMSLVGVALAGLLLGARRAKARS
jgi:hypothetical protein